MECSAIMLIEKYKALTVTKPMAASAYKLYITVSLPLKVEHLNIISLLTNLQNKAFCQISALLSTFFTALEKNSYNSSSTSTQCQFTVKCLFPPLLTTFCSLVPNYFQLGFLILAKSCIRIYFKMSQTMLPYIPNVFPFITLNVLFLVLV